MTEISDWDDFGFPWGNPDDPALKVEAPAIHVSMSSSGMNLLREYHYKNNKIAGVMAFAGIMIVIAFVGGLVSTCVTDKGIGIGVGMLIVILSVIILIISSSIATRNSKKATSLFKNQFVRRELSPYVERLQLLDAEYCYNQTSGSRSGGDDLSGPMPPEYVIRALGLSNSSCNDNHVKEWMSGFYHGTRFRFFEVKLVNVYYTGFGKNKEKHEELVYNGQGYIFKTKVRMPFPIQYNFNNNVTDIEDLTVENFDKIFKSFRCKNLWEAPNFEAKETLTEAELKVFNKIEAREFKVCLLKLAKIYYDVLKLHEKMLREDATLKKLCGNNTLTVRLMNENIVILREGPFDYFEIDLARALEQEFDKFSKELSEFVSVLETMGSLSLVSGGEESDSF
ncbi:MAG: hypothetical protein IJU23_13105 [Proteobacteria bacterium]|nr:hypothetical protein [Pseudomonadota bacterium]